MTYRFTIIAFVVILFNPCAAYSADGKYDQLRSYFPMEKGSVWIYNSLTNTPDTIVIVNDCGYDDYGIKFCIFKETIMELNTVHTAYTYQGDSVLIKLEQNAFKGNNVETFLPPKVLLKYPLSLGSTWITATTDEMNFQSKIVKIIPLMEVKAGKFSQVLKVESKWFVKQNNGKMKFEEKETVVVSYYAPNVGLILEEAYNIGLSKKYNKNKKVKVLRTQELVEYRPVNREN